MSSVFYTLYQKGWSPKSQIPKGYLLFGIAGKPRPHQKHWSGSDWMGRLMGTTENGKIEPPIMLY
tara:strand:- start:184 stop:378 length:195 start_codon:yes stop_codon:yes gene_type:complete